MVIPITTNTIKPGYNPKTNKSVKLAPIKESHLLTICVDLHLILIRSLSLYPILTLSSLCFPSSSHQWSWTAFSSACATLSSTSLPSSTTLSCKSITTISHFSLSLSFFYLLIIMCWIYYYYELRTMKKSVEWGLLRDWFVNLEKNTRC